MKTLVLKLDILLEIDEVPVAAASMGSEPENVPEEMNQLNAAVDNLLKSMGFCLIGQYSDNPSTRNGGWAFYNSYIMVDGDNKIKLIVAMRTADHASKPNIARKNINRMKGEVDVELRNKLAKERYNLNEDDVELVDAYYKKNKLSVKYYLGKGDKYGEPVDSLDKFISYLKERILRLIKKH
jgi:hypothetical protein